MKTGQRIMAELPASTASPVGQLLKQWRERRRMSQMALALEAEVSSRHLSFVNITLHELRIESFFPADEATEAALRRLEAVSQ